MKLLISDASSSTFRVQTLAAAGAPPTNDNGTLNWAQRTNAQTDHPLGCGGYQARDTNQFQFFLGRASLGTILYKITYTVPNTKPDQAQFCLGRVNFPFTTMSNKQSPRATLPNGRQGYVGLLPMCSPSDVGTLTACVVSKSASGSDTVLTVQVPALKGDPWGRS